MAATASKSEAHYRDGTAKRHCGICAMFRPPHGCTAVVGVVSRHGLCDYFKRKHDKIAEDYVK